MDEPTSSLAEDTAESLLRLMSELISQGMVWRSCSLPIPCQKTFKVADRFVVLRDGKLVATTLAKDARESAIVEMMVGRPLSQHYLSQSEICDRVLRELQPLHARRASQREPVSRPRSPGRLDLVGGGVAGAIPMSFLESAQGLAADAPLSEHRKPSGPSGMAVPAVRCRSPRHLKLAGEPYSITRDAGLV
jgi:hypothetical protein